MDKFKRLFFALWPDEQTRHHCFELASKIRQPQAAIIPPTNLHITLVFLGKVSAEQETLLRQQATNIKFNPIIVDFVRLSYWKKPQIACLTVAAICPELLALVNQLTEAALRTGIAIDNRPYRPHVTLLKKANALAETEITPFTWQANTFCLVESCQVKDKPGVQYRIIGQWQTSDQA